MKYIDAEKLIKAIEEKGLHCSFALKMERLDTLALIDSLQQEQPEMDLEKAALNFGEEIGVPVSNTFMQIARHFYEIGQKDAANKYDEVEYNRQRAEEESLGKTLDEAAHQYAWNKQEHHIDFDGDEYLDYGPRYDAFIAGAKWMAGQGETLKVTDDTTWGEVNDFIHRNCDGVKEIQIRKKEESK